MNNTVLKILSAAPGVPLLVNAVGFVVDPEKTLASLGMPLLEGVGRSTQLGDGGALFFCSAMFIFYGAFSAAGRWLRAGAFMMGSVAVMRILAWSINGAEFATQFIAIEVVLTIWLLSCAHFLDKSQ